MDTIETLTRTAGGALQPHRTIPGQPAHIADYGCRRCWKEMRQHASQSGVCTIGPNESIIHRDCCPVCMDSAAPAQ